MEDLLIIGTACFCTDVLTGIAVTIMTMHSLFKK